MQLFDPAAPIELRFKVVDTGKGIAENEKEKLFKVFSQTASGEDLQEGIGLGLHISQEFVRMLGGGIDVESKLNKGSTFSFDLRVKVADKETAEPSALKGPVIGIEPDQCTYRILIVDDNEENREILSELIYVLSFPLREAVNGKEAIEIFRTWNPDLIFMDLMMPIMDGFEATKRIRAMAEDRGPVIIAVTAGALHKTTKGYAHKGFDDSIFKPFHEDIIFSKISKHLNINYLYQNFSPRMSSSNWSAEVSADQLARQPPSWQKKLYSFATEGETEEATKLIADISEKQPQLAKSLYALVEHYRFDKLVQLLNESMDNRGNER